MKNQTSLNPFSLASLVAIGASLAPARVAAEPVSAPDSALVSAPARDTATKPGSDARSEPPPPRPWLYTADPTPPSPGRVLASLGVGYAQLDRGAARPFAADVAHAGAVFNASAEVGVARYVSVHAEGLLSGQGDGSPLRAGAFLGASVFPFARRLPVDVAISAGYLRELGSDNGLWGRVAVAGNIGPARLSMTALAEHVFASGRDGVDVLLTSGASVEVTSFARLGAEYVVQDLEGAWDPEEADGGIRHFIGPNAVILLGHGVQLAAGPSFGLSQGSPSLLGRLTATYAF